VRSNAFTGLVKRFYNTPFDVEIIWPESIPASQVGLNYAMIERAFANVSAIYPMLPDELATRHTVLVTAGVAGDSHLYEGRIYPEPGTNLSSVVRSIDQQRAEELFIHAVAHLYNRHRTYWIGDQKERLPIPESEWQELTATWCETAYVSKHSWRLYRLEYMYNVHVAVQTKDFSRITGPPFDDPVQFEKIRGVIIPPRRSSDAQMQYSHYILSPLSMVAIEGLLGQLAEAGRIEDTGVEALLIEVHSGKHDSFFAALENLLPAEVMERVRGWWERGESIPRELVFRGAERYRGKDPRR
jgi:hypothetical protein